VAVCVEAVVVAAVVRCGVLVAVAEPAGVSDGESSPQPTVTASAAPPIRTSVSLRMILRFGSVCLVIVSSYG